MLFDIDSNALTDRTRSDSPGCSRWNSTCMTSVQRRVSDGDCGEVEKLYLSSLTMKEKLNDPEVKHGAGHLYSALKSSFETFQEILHQASHNEKELMRKEN